MAKSGGGGRKDVFFAVVSYSACSGTLVLLNKLVLRQLNYPSLIVCLQLAATLAFIAAGKVTGRLRVDPVTWSNAVPYGYYVVAFAIGAYCNMRSLAMSKVETIIVFRAMSPCLVAVLDSAFLGREYPARRTWFALALLVFGAYRYASFDDTFHNQSLFAYAWPFFYLCVISFSMAYGKHIIRSVGLKTRSGPVLYTNLLSIGPLLLLAVFDEEYSRLKHDREAGIPVSTATWLLLGLGCMAGTGIGYTSWWCLDRVSATTFCVIGVINKCVTILLNPSVRDIDEPRVGLFSLGLCLIGGYLYREAPMKGRGSSKIIANAADEVWEEDLSLREEFDEEEICHVDSDLSKRTE